MPASIGENIHNVMQENKTPSDCGDEEDKTTNDINSKLGGNGTDFFNSVDETTKKRIEKNVREEMRQRYINNQHPMDWTSLREDTEIDKQDEEVEKFMVALYEAE